MAGVIYQDNLDHQLDAERAVIGSMLIDEHIVPAALAKVDPADFCTPAYRLAFQAARALFRDGDAVDRFSIRNKMGQEYSGFLAELVAYTPTSANWEVYAEAMHEQATLRRLHAYADALAQAATLDDCRPIAAGIAQQLAAGRQVDAWTMREMLEDFFKAQDPDAPAPSYVTYGLEVLDRRNYTELGDVVMIGGYPSDGKTALALMMAYHMAAGHKVGFFSLETDKRKVRDRIVSSVARIDFDAIKRRELAEEDWAGLAAMTPDMSKRDLTVLRASGMTVTDIQATSQAYGFDVVFIDYVQLIVPEVGSRAPRSEQMADVSRSLHTFAQSSGTLVVELAQLTRQERGGWREPDMHDLKESGQFEQDADVIFLLFRPNPMDEALDQDKNRILKIGKYKEGPRGKWPLYFDGPKQTFSVLAGPDGKAVMRQMVGAGKAAKAKNKAAATAKNKADTMDQEALPEFEEITGAAAAEVPF